MNIPYYDELVQCRAFLEQKHDSFPDDYCQQSSKLISFVTGIEEVAGHYRFGSGYLWHAWSYDSNTNLHVDLTMDQFSSYNDKITLLSSSSSRLILSDKETKIHKSFNKLFSKNDLVSLIDEYYSFASGQSTL